MPGQTRRKSNDKNRGTKVLATISLILSILVALYNLNNDVLGYAEFKKVRTSFEQLVSETKSMKEIIHRLTEKLEDSSKKINTLLWKLTTSEQEALEDLHQIVNIYEEMTTESRNIENKIPEPTAAKKSPTFLTYILNRSSVWNSLRNKEFDYNKLYNNVLQGINGLKEKNKNIDTVLVKLQKRFRKDAEIIKAVKAEHDSIKSFLASIEISIKPIKAAENDGAIEKIVLAKSSYYNALTKNWHTNIYTITTVGLQNSFHKANDGIKAVKAEQKSVKAFLASIEMGIEPVKAAENDGLIKKIPLAKSLLNNAPLKNQRNNIYAAINEGDISNRAAELSKQVTNESLTSCALKNLETTAHADSGSFLTNIAAQSVETSSEQEYSNEKREIDDINLENKASETLSNDPTIQELDLAQKRIERRFDRMEKLIHDREIAKRQLKKLESIVNSEK